MSCTAETSAWNLRLLQAADLFSSVLTPFFLNATECIKAGKPPAVMQLLREHALTLDACFEVTTIILDSNNSSKSSSTINPQHLPLLSIAFQVLMAWKPKWPSEHFICHQRRLASLNRLLEHVVLLARNLIPHAPNTCGGLHLVIDTVMFTYVFLQMLAFLPPPKMSRTLATLPTTLLPHMFQLMDEQLHCLKHGHSLATLHRITATVLELKAACAITTPIFSPALVGLAKHLLVASVRGEFSFPTLAHTEKEMVKCLEATAVMFLFDASKLGVIQQSAVDNGCIQKKGRMSTLSIQPSVTDHMYFQALCLCTASSVDFGSKRNNMPAAALIGLELKSWRSGEAH